MITQRIPPSIRSPIARREWLAILVIALVGLGLRAAGPERLAVEHFDEGVYASNIWFGDRPEGTYPSQQLYAPPLLPALIEWCFVFSGPSNHAAMWPSQVAGTLSVIVIWGLGRRWFGPLAGLVAAALCATNETHLLLSRAALTDALLGLWWLAAIWSLHRACESGKALDRMAAGVFIALAWFTKYNGWMPLGIVTGAVLTRAALTRCAGQATRRALTTCLVAGLIAFALWSPWLWSLQSKGGYSSVAANHRQYVVGLTGWWPSAVRQIDQLQAVRGLLSETTWLIGFVALLACLLVKSSGPIRTSRLPLRSQEPGSEPTCESPAPTSSRMDSLPCLGTLALLTAYPFAAIPASLLLALQGLGFWYWTSSHRTDPQSFNLDCQSDRPSHADLSYWILAVWFGGLLIATPLYRPYLRLTLPEILGNCLAIGLTVQQAMASVGWCRLSHLASNHSHPDPAAAGSRRIIGTPLIWLLACLGLTRAGFNFAQQASTESVSRALPDQSSLPRAARQIATQLETHPDSSVPNALTTSLPTAVPNIVYVYAEPSLLFQLRLAGLQNVAPVSSLKFTSSQFSTPAARIYLAVGLHALSDPQFREQFAAVQPQLRSVGRWPWQLGPLVALDQPSSAPQQLGQDPVESAAVELFEVLAP